MVLVSNRVVGFEWGGMKNETSIEAQLKKKAADVPKTTNTSMVGDP